MSNSRPKGSEEAYAEIGKLFQRRGRCVENETRNANGKTQTVNLQNDDNAPAQRNENLYETFTNRYAQRNGQQT